MTQRIGTRKSFIGTALVAGAVIVGGTATALQREATDPPSPAAGHSQVVATWLVNLEDGSYEWNVAEHQVDSVGTDLTDTAPTFLIGDDHVALTLHDRAVIGSGRRHGSPAQPVVSAASTSASSTASARS